MAGKNRTAISLAINLTITVLSFIVLMNSLSRGELWRIIFTSAGFIVFPGFSIALLNELSKQRKSIKRY
ncbi:hypothetical protein BMS3Abin04_02549 [bacterium BMS3Abin04]|nr:hypothetical protein BMS3Abin04_02549 [bacterium BMS3Abin04]